MKNVKVDISVKKYLSVRANDTKRKWVRFLVKKLHKKFPDVLIRVKHCKVEFPYTVYLISRDIILPDSVLKSYIAIEVCDPTNPIEFVNSNQVRFYVGHLIDNNRNMPSLFNDLHVFVRAASYLNESRSY